MSEIVDLPMEMEVFDVSFGPEHIMLRSADAVFHLSAPLELRDAQGSVRAKWIPDETSVADAECFMRLIPRTLIRARVRYDGTLLLRAVDGQALVVLPEPDSPHESWYAVGTGEHGDPWTLTCASGTPEVFVVATGPVEMPRRS